MSNQECPVCGAKWIDGQLYWATGRPGSNLDLNALVCRGLAPEKAKGCINPSKGKDGGIGWKERMEKMQDGSWRDL